MTYKDIRLDDEVENRAQGGPEFRTLIKALSSGFEDRNRSWERAHLSWNVGYGMDTKAGHENVIAQFYIMGGKADSFPFKDWTDFNVGTTTPEVPQEIFIADGVLVDFQIVRRYEISSFTFDRAITRPVNGTVRVFFATTEQFAGFTIDVTTGVITFSVAPVITTSIRVICEFNVPSRFDIDMLNLSAVRDDAFTIPRVMVREDQEELAILT